jgi:hypothetical protein
MKPAHYFLILIALLIVYILIRNFYVDHFRKKLKHGSRVKFFIKEEKYYGIVKRSDPDQALVEFMQGTIPDYLLLSKSNLYPSW